MIKNKKIKFSFIVIIIFILFSFRNISFASTNVFFEKNIDTIKKGDTFQVDLKISSSKPINVIDGTITYDKDKLEIKNIEKDDSKFSMWVKEPIFNNQSGELVFVGGIPTGFNGDNGKILTINFLAKKEGPTTIGFKDIFSVYINDGNGTKINPWLKPLSISIDKKVNDFSYLYNYTWVFILIVILFIIILLIKIKKRKNDK
jgi:hypothetical protein